MKGFLWGILFIMGSLAFFACGPISDPKDLAYAGKDSIKPEENALLTIVKDDEYPIACYYFDPRSKDYGQGLFKKSAYVWAKIKSYDYVVARGAMQDGFLVASSIDAVDRSHPTKKVADTIAQLEDICQKSIDETYHNRGFMLYKLFAYKTILPNATKYPVVIASEEASKLSKNTRLLVFGDSLSDTGRLLSSLKVFPNAPYFLGRFSNGPIWSDILAITGDLAVQNRSKGGAVTDPNIDFNVSEIISMVRDRGRGLVTGSSLKTIRDYLRDKTTNNHMAAGDKTLIMLWVGGNDYVAKFDTDDDMTTLIDMPDIPKKGSRWVADFSVRNVIDQLRYLYEAGGRHFMVGNLPDLGKTPMIVENKTYKGSFSSEQERVYHLSIKFTAIAQYHNMRLKEELVKLQNEKPDAKFILFDAFAALENIIMGKGPDGEENFTWGLNRAKSFTTITAPGKEPIVIGKRCYTGTYTGSSDPSKVCSDSRQMLFWDDIHPTAQGQCSLAFMIHRQLTQEGLIATKPDFDDYQKLCGLKFNR